MSARTYLSVLTAVMLAGPCAWAFSGGYGGGGPLPEPQIGKFRQRNFENLERLKVGMSGAQVSEVMGDRKDVQTYNLTWEAETISNPVRLDSRRGRDGKTHQIRYYYAYHMKGDVRITIDELCPVVFSDGLLAGWGWAYYEKEVGPIPTAP